MKFKIINTMQNNLSSLLVHEFSFRSFFNCKYSRCSNDECLTCNYANLDFKILIKDSYFIPIWDNSNCNSLNCVYVIYCKLCNCFYVGQTNSIKKRIYKHIYDIKNFVPYKTYNTCVSIHFNLKNHLFQEHLNFFVYRCNVDEKARLNLESFLINWFLQIGAVLINDFIPKIKTIYN